MQKKLVVIDIFSKVAKKYDLLNNVISFGVHNFWRRKLISNINTKIYENVLDLCSGTGTLLPYLSKVSKNLYALDISKEMLEIAKEKCLKQKIDVEFVECEAEAMPFNNNFFDLVVVAYGVRNFYNLDKGLAEIKRILNKNGTLYILEFGKQNKNIWWHKIFSFYMLHIMPFIIRIFSGERRAYKYLTDTILKFPSGEEFSKILKKNGLECEHFDIMLGGFVYFYSVKPIK